MQNDSENDALWKLLGKSPEKPVSPLFTRRVLREVRAWESSGARSASLSWADHWQVLRSSGVRSWAALAACLVLAGAFFASLPDSGREHLLSDSSLREAFDEAAGLTGGLTVDISILLTSQDAQP